MTPEATPGAEWIASADPDPRHVFDQWRTHRLHTALIPTGVRFDAVAVSLELVHLMTTAPSPVDTAPLLYDEFGQRGYVLVPPGTADSWHLPSTRPLGRGSWVAMPEPGAQRWRPHLRWVVAPDGSGTAADPAALRDYITVRLRPALREVAPC
ncbi:hypothetical protein ACIQU6_40060 [Streptomyces sp. NPDC090442]|uniref:hypothetical protein n=1 Tax=Streptomyces sp. NPDC090442 TaxID=3365962 RepID=UPI00380337B3